MMPSLSSSSCPVYSVQKVVPARVSVDERVGSQLYFVLENSRTFAERVPVETVGAYILEADSVLAAPTAQREDL